MRAENEINWKKLKVIAFESDDWCGADRGGWHDLETYNKSMQNPVIARAYNGNLWHTAKDTLESVEDMDTLFKILLRFRGKDDRPAVFTPICFLANPDFEAIRANGFTKYVDIGIDKPYAENWQSRGDIIGKAREGIELGVWCPESHNTRAGSHHDPHKWVKYLHDRKDEALNTFFDLNMVGRPSETTTDMGLEFDSMEQTELEDWISGGFQYFKNAFGYTPRVSGIADARIRCRILGDIMQKLLAQNGVTTIVNAGHKEIGEVNRELGLTYIKRNANFEPALLRQEKEGPGKWKISDNQEPWSDSCYRDIVAAWENNQPAIVNTHRVNFSSLDPDKKAESFRQLESMLAKIQKEHPEAIYRSSHEIGEMYLNENIS